MAKANTPAKEEILGDANVPLKIPGDLRQQVKETSEAIHLSEADTMRQAMRRGLPILKQLLTSAAIPA